MYDPLPPEIKANPESFQRFGVFKGNSSPQIGYLTPVEFFDTAEDAANSACQLTKEKAKSHCIIKLVATVKPITQPATARIFYL